MVSSSPPVLYSFSIPATEATAAKVSLEYFGVSGSLLCRSMWPRCHFCVFLPQMLGRYAGPSGDAIVADSGSQSCEDEQRRTQARNCDSDAPTDDHMFVRRGNRRLSICLLGFSSAWEIVSASSFRIVKEAGPMIPSMVFLFIMMSSKAWFGLTVIVKAEASRRSFLLYLTSYLARSS